ncbi:hypothetical protein B9J78_00570 [bacterium Unc6]|nr:hypothetical protein [bacterium Unc6]
MLLEQRVRLVLWRTTSDFEGAVIIVRGTITDESPYMLRVDGRLYQQMIDEKGGTIERPIGTENQSLLIPITTIRYGEIIIPGTPAEELDKKVRLQKPLGKGEIRKKGGLT